MDKTDLCRVSSGVPPFCQVYRVETTHRQDCCLGVAGRGPGWQHWLVGLVEAFVL
jgi:hypothetical protein